MAYYPFGVCRNSPENFPTERLFTGQRLDDTGLYYYGARYYDATMGKFISADTIIPNPANTQAFNRYSYCLNNPLKYMDPNGHVVTIGGWDVRVLSTIGIYGYNVMYSDMFRDSGLAEAYSSPEYQAYQAVREYHTQQATKLENLNEIVNIQFGQTNHPRQDSIMRKNDGEFNIILNNNIARADAFYQANAILSASYEIMPISFFPDLSDFPTSDQAIIAYDIAAFSGDIISIIGTFTGNPPAAFGGYWAWGDTSGGWPIPSNAVTYLVPYGRYYFFVEP